MAAPDSLAGSRLYREPNAQDEAAITAYGARMLSLLEACWRLAEGSRNELEPSTLEMSTEAKKLWQAFHDDVEVRSGPQGDLHAIVDFAAKSAEHAARIAGVLSIVEDAQAFEISGRTMSSALTLTGWYLDEALRLRRSARTDPKLLHAQALLDWMRNYGQVDIAFRDILRLGPSATRTKAAAEAVLATLKAHGQIVENGHRPLRLRVFPEGGRMSHGDHGMVLIDGKVCDIRDICDTS